MIAVVPRSLVRSLVGWYRRNRRDLPWRRTRDPYRIWIAEVMLQQTTVRAVVPYYGRFLRRFPTLRALSRAPLSALLATWSGLGYYKRARNLRAAARLIARRHKGRFPADPQAARALPGVGRYTAGAVLSIAYGQKEPVLDGNVARVLSRIALVRQGTRTAAGRRELWALAQTLAEAAAAPGDLNQALMELGATLCTPLDPGCPRCPVRNVCAARAAGIEDSIPPRRTVRAPVTLRTAVALVSRSGRLLMRRRAGTGLMDGLWEFPPLREGGAGGGPRLRSLGKVVTVRHSITYRRLRVEVHRARLLSEPVGSDYRWVSPRTALRLPTSSLVSKILGRACAGAAADGAAGAV